MDLMSGIDKLVGRIGTNSFLNNIDYRVARSKDELEKAYSLVYKEYLKRSYTDEQESGLRLSIYNALPQTTTFIGAVNGDVLATATIIPDSVIGIPMDAIYKQELDRLRENKKKVCEVSMLASNTDIFKSGMSMLLNAKKMFFIFMLFKRVFDYVRDVLNFDCICITIHPKHKLTYDFLLFKDLGGLKTYDSVNEAPAIAKYIDVNEAVQECLRQKKEGLYRMFFDRKSEPKGFASKIIMSPEDLKYFFTVKTDILTRACDYEIEYLKRCYPAYDFSQIIQ